MIDTGMLPQHGGNSHADDPEDAEAFTKNYIKAINKGLYKVFENRYQHPAKLLLGADL